MKLKLKTSIKVVFAVLIFLIIVGITLLIVLKKPEESNNFVVSFNSEGGSLVKDIIIKENNILEEPDIPIKEGYTFLGWFYHDELFDFSKKIKENVELTAKWEEIKEENIPPEKETIELSQNYYELKVGDTITLEFTKLPKDVDASTLIYMTSNSLVAKASQGTLKAISPGNATITIKTSDNKIFTTCNVVVTSDVIEITKLSINGPSEVKVGESIKLEALITPSNATNKEVFWTSNKESIAKISDDGTLTGLKAGEVIITLTTMNLKTAEKKITVLPNETQNQEKNEESGE